MRKLNRGLARWMLLFTLSLALAPAGVAQEKKLTLQEAVDLAVKQNHGLKAASFALAVEEQKRRIAKSNYFPRITNESDFLHITDLQRLEIPAGAFGEIPGGALIPASNVF